MGYSVKAGINTVPSQADGSFASIGLTPFPVANSLKGTSVRFGQGDGTFGSIINYPTVWFSGAFVPEEHFGEHGQGWPGGYCLPV